MALYVTHSGQAPNPLGGREAEGFGQWLTNTAQTMRRAEAAARDGRPKGDSIRYVAIGAARHYDSVLGDWRDVTAGRDERARNRFEVGLISKVMSAHGAAEFAQGRGYGPTDATAGGRPMADISAEYLRAGIILARYVGIPETDVYACGGDQAGLSALRG